MPTKKSKQQKEIAAAEKIQNEQMNRHSEILVGWEKVDLRDSNIRRALLDAAKEGSLEKWEATQFVCGTKTTDLQPDTPSDDEFPPLKGNGPVVAESNLPMPRTTQNSIFKYGSPSKAPGNDAQISPTPSFIVIQGECIRIGGETQWPPGTLEVFRKELKQKTLERTAEVQKVEASLVGNGTVAKPPALAAPQPSDAWKLVETDATALSATRVVSASNSPQNTSQKKSVPRLLPKSPTVSVSSVGRERAVSSSSSAKQGSPVKGKTEKTVLRVRPNPPKEKMVDEDGFEVVSPKKSAPPKKVDAPRKERVARPAPVASSSSSVPPPSQPAKLTPALCNSETSSKNGDKKKKKKATGPEESEDDMLARLIAENSAIKEAMIALEVEDIVEKEAKKAKSQTPKKRAPEPVADKIALPTPIPDSLTAALIRKKIYQLEGKTDKLEYHTADFTVKTDTLEEAINIREEIGLGCRFTLVRGPNGELVKIPPNEETKNEDEKRSDK